MGVNIITIKKYHGADVAEVFSMKTCKKSKQLSEVN